MNFKKVFYSFKDKAVEHSPEALIVIGVAGFVCTIVSACKATTKAGKIIDAHNEQINSVNAILNDPENYEGGEEYTLSDAKKDKAIIFSHTAIDFVKLYGVSAAFGVVSLSCFLGAYAIVKKRYIAASILAAGLSDTLKKYRERVISELGSEVDDHFLNGTKIDKIKVTELTEDGKTKTHSEEIAYIHDKNNIPIYAKFFDESNVNWCKSPGTNLLFLRGQQARANDLFKARGRLLLNEVYSLLGIEQTEIGTMVGWFEGHGDDFVDFGIYDGNERTRAFVNGYEPSILLNFNCTPRHPGDLAYA